MHKTPTEEDADMIALQRYEFFEKYIETMGGRFFFNADNESGKPFFDELARLLPNLVKIYAEGKTCYRARIVHIQTGSHSIGEGGFDAFSKDQLGAPPNCMSNDGRVNPRGISYLYLATSRRCALSEVRPTISSLVAIGEGVLHKDVKLISFTNPSWPGITPEERSFIELVGSLYSRPVNGQNSIEYLPSQVVSEYIKHLGFDGVEYNSSQNSEGIVISLFDTTAWSADCAKTFQVSNITYTAIRDPCLVEVFGCPDEEL